MKKRAGVGLEAVLKKNHSYGIALIKNSPLISNLSARLDFSLVNLESLSPKQNEFKISVFFRYVAPPFKKPGPSADFEKLKGGVN